MSELLNSRKKHKNKPNKNKTKPKRKTCLTQEYQENERAVQQWLESTSLSLDLGSESKEVDDVSQSIDFFCTSNEGTTAESGKRKPPKSLAKVPIVDHHEDSPSDVEAEESNSKSSSATASPTHENQTTASTYIQIDADVVTRSGVNLKLHYDADLLFIPSKDLQLSLQMQTDEVVAARLDANTKRILNRYYEESKEQNTKVNKLILEALQTAAQETQHFIKNPALYRTFCSHEFHPIFCKPSPDAIEIPTRKLIKVYLKELRFTEHPQLLEEHRLANTIEDLYERYSQYLRDNVVEKMKSELKTERSIVNELLKQEANQHPTDLSLTQRAQTLEQHLLAVKSLRERLYAEEAEIKRLISSILETWLKLKNLRKSQEYQCTRFKLLIIVEQPTDVVAESEKWTKRFETDLNEIYREELEIYYRAKRLWNKRNRNVESSLVRPTKPELTQISRDLKRKLAECLHAPGEPKVEIWQSRCSDEEYYDMPGPRKLKSFFMKIYFDKEYVGVTRSYRLDPDLRLCINEAIGIFLERRLPKEIRLALYEKSKLTASRKIANINIPAPSSTANENDPIKYVQFDSHKQSNIAGRIGVRLHYDEQSYTKAEVLEALRPPMRDELPETNHIFSMINNNEEVLEDEPSSSTVDEVSESKKAAATCTFEEELLRFCSLETLEQNARFKLLRSRYQKNDLRTKDLRFVPLLEHEIEFDWEEQEEAVIQAGNWMHPIDLHKHEGKKFLRNLYAAIFNQCGRLNRVRQSSENLLIGDEPASWSSFFQTLALIFNPSRPLQASRTSTFSSNTQPKVLDQSQDFRIILNVVRATGIPVRNRILTETEQKTMRSNSSGSGNMFMTQNLKYSNVRPFVALGYRDKLCRTVTAEGSNPTWNEQLILQMSGNFKDMRDDIKILLFDEVVENHINEEHAVRNMDIYQRIQTNWLAEYRIPISSILWMQKTEGVLELNSPRVLLSYKRASLDNITTNSDTNIMIEHYPEVKETIRLWYYLTIEPLRELPQISTSCLECSELREVRQQLYDWGLQIRELWPQRFLEPLICTADGKRVCITRLLEAIPLPITASENLVDSACRFVSLLSVLKNYDACGGFRGVWLNNQLILDTTWCSPKDLGVLLCNFLLSIGLQCWLVLGTASPYGECTFALYKSEEAELVLIDPSTGKRYSTRDVFCPLTKIIYVVASTNLYCNIQSETRLSMMNFNFNDSSCWLAAFSKKHPAPLGGVQCLSYTYREAFNTQELLKSIERKIMKKISSWRTMRKTIWNRAFQPRLQSMLRELEHSTTFSSGSYDEFKHTNQLNAEFPSYKINGFTLNFSYTNLSSISDRIKSTGVHLNADKNVEYSLAVHLHAYPSNVLSVWVFIITVVPI